MSRWFRFYDTAIDDPKVQRLPGDLFKTWVNILCLASRNGGVLPSVQDMAFSLRLSDEEAEKRLVALKAAGLIDEADAEIRPHNWDKRQFRSDSSAERVKRHRDRKCNVTSAVTETPPETEAETETETETELLSASSPQPARACEPEFRQAIMTEYLRAGSTRLPDTGRAGTWIAQGYRPELCIAVIREILPRKPNVPLTYFDGPIRDAHAQPRSSTGPPIRQSAHRTTMDFLDRVIADGERSDGGKVLEGDFLRVPGHGEPRRIA